MDHPFAAFAVVAGAYLLGTFPTAILVGRSTGHDPTTEGSGNPGASNVYRTSGRRAGATVLVGDLLKGAIPAVVGWLVGGRPLGAAAWVAAVLGHVYPATRRFRGGKGVATAGGGVIVLFPVAAVLALPVFVAVIKRWRQASLGSLSMAVLVPLLVAVLGRPGWEVAVAAGVAGVLILRHAGNMRRLLQGAEHRVGPGADGGGIA